MLRLVLAVFLLVPSGLSGQQRASAGCGSWDPHAIRRNPSALELRCRFGALGPGRFGLLSYLDVPVYQPATPMPGTHVVGVAGHPGPAPGESYEEWEWRVLRTRFGPEVQRAQRGLDLLDPFVAGRIMRLEARLAEEGVRAVRRETWRSPERQAYIFQQGRSRPGLIATGTLTSWHSHVDSRGMPAGRAVDYNVARGHLPRFHQIARSVGLQSFGADSNDPDHVFLPETEALPTVDVVLLRVLPRVPEVTLATGLPTDRPLPPGGAAELRARSLQFAASYFIPAPVPAVAGIRPIPLLARAIAGDALAWTTCPGERPDRSAEGGARCELPESAERGAP